MTVVGVIPGLTRNLFLCWRLIKKILEKSRVLVYNIYMAETTIVNSSPVGKHLDKIGSTEQVSYLMFNKQRIQLVAKITIGRETDNSIVIDSKLASRHHCHIQKIKDQFFLKDENSTNGTFLNGRRIPPDKYVLLNKGDKITVGSSNLIMS